MLNNKLAKEDKSNQNFLNFLGTSEMNNLYNYKSNILTTGSEFVGLDTQSNSKYAVIISV